MKLSYRSYLLVAGLAGLTVSAVAGQSVIANQLNDWQLLPRPERLTELYFADNQQLSTEIEPGTTQKLVFTIHNDEHRRTTYQYKLVAVSDEDGVTQSLGDGTTTLAHDQYQTIQKIITLFPTGRHVTVKVELEYEGQAPGNSMQTTQKQSIDYQLKVAGGQS